MLRRSHLASCDLMPSQDCADAAALAAAAEEAEASSATLVKAPQVSFTVLLDGGGFVDVSDAEGASTLPPGEVRLQLTLRDGYPHRGMRRRASKCGLGRPSDLRGMLRRGCCCVSGCCYVSCRCVMAAAAV
jgi:hypothetical protein